MSLIYELDVDTMKTYLCTKNEDSRWRLSKVRAQTGLTDIHMDRQELVLTKGHWCSLAGKEPIAHIKYLTAFCYC